MSTKSKLKIKKRQVKRYLLRHQEIFTISAIAAGVLVIQLLAL